MNQFDSRTIDLRSIGVLPSGVHQQPMFFYKSFVSLEDDDSCVGILLEEVLDSLLYH